MPIAKIFINRDLQGQPSHCSLPRCILGSRSRGEAITISRPPEPEGADDTADFTLWPKNATDAEELYGRIDPLAANCLINSQSSEPHTDRILRGSRDVS